MGDVEDSRKIVDEGGKSVGDGGWWWGMVGNCVRWWGKVQRGGGGGVEEGDYFMC